MSYKGVIFDLDGTLLDTIADLGNCMNSVLERLGLPTHGLDKYKYFVGDGLLELTRRALGEHLGRDESLVQNVIQAQREEYGRRWAESTVPYDGIEPMLRELGRRGMKLAVLTNKPDDFTHLVMQRFLPAFSFDAVLGAKPELRLKPDPAGAIQIARQLDIQPQQFLYLGDTNTDMLCANAAGMYAVGVLWGFRQADELLAHGAKALLKRPGDVLELLG